MSGFKDHFSGHASVYASARPGYPRALFDWIASLAMDQALAWDAGCGNGQAAVALAQDFDAVMASDPSAEQIAQAPRHARVDYRVEAAEDCSLPAESVDAACVAQALHWFDLSRFFPTLLRVLKPGGVLVAWTYESCRVDPAVDAVFDRLYLDRLGPWWPPERRLVERGYRDIALPAPLLPVSEVPAMSIQLDWTLEQYLDYLRSWSASARCLRETGRDAVGEFAPEIGKAWGPNGHARRVTWPLAILAGRRAA